MSFIHLHVYSAYSLLTSTATVEQLVKEAKSKGFTSLALTDRNVMYGAIAFYKECLKNSLKPIIGLTIDVASEFREKEAFQLVLLAMNNQGFQNLIKISSAVQTRSPDGIPVKWLKAYSGGLIAITPGTGGEIEQFLSAGEQDKASAAVDLYSSMFGSQKFFISLHNQELPGQAALNKQLAALAESRGIRTVAANPVHYLHRQDAFAQECLLAIKNGQKLQDEEREKLGSDDFYLKTAAEMAELFSEYPDALENTLKIAEQCNVLIDLETKHLPQYPAPPGETSDGLLEKLCRTGFETRYGKAPSGHWQRLEYELSVIKRMKFSDYFLIVWDFMRFARENGILTGPGRGSAAGSMVAYVLFITDVDPIEHQLLFERFLNPERISMPDIDIDFPDHRRDEVIEYVASKYGELHVAQIVTFGTLAAKAALRDTGRAFGLNTKELDRLSRLVPSKLGISLTDAFKESEGLRSFIKESDMNAKLFETALKLEGLPRHTSTHAAGVVISGQPLTNVIPIQSGSERVLLTQYSMEHLEEVGLLKMDFLGLRNLSLIEAILESIHRKTGREIDIHNIPLDDRQTFELLSEGDTTGIFQLESEGMRKVLVKLKPSRFEDIVAVNALYRPGPMENIPLFIARKHGREEVAYPHDDLKDILENTYGVIVYQEQIMQIASTMAGFSLGEADLLRRAVGKKKKEVLDRERGHFVSGALKKGYDEKTANDIYDLIVRFANYGFNRSHAIAYSFIAYQLAYLKAQYPLYFMAALCTSAMGNDAKIAQYARELKQMEIPLLPPSINKSSYSFQAEGGKIRYSLAAIKGVGAQALREIFQARKQRPFKDLFDFCIRVSQKAVNRKTMEALVHSGAFDEFGQDRASLLASLDVAIEHALLVAPDESGQFDLFAEAEFSIKPKYTVVDPMPVEQKLAYEKDVLGFYLSKHPVSIFEEVFKAANVQLLALKQGGQRCRIGVYITETKKIRTKKGDPMCFLTLSDPSGETEAVAFPNEYRRFGPDLKQGEITLLEGKFEERDGKVQFIIQSVLNKHAALEAARETGRKLFIRVGQGRHSVEMLTELKAMLKKHYGEIPVILYYEHNQKTVLLPAEFKVNADHGCLKELRGFLGKENVVLKN
ncbi:DNA polymerase III subunit alpha [Bacillus sp. T33-2]|uniref:DNA polymerase III subunit alpha n=1 Tax=Bacillus sp. T33-2 TaxID=2054168 RepID=UPI000C76F439|nr:DNA polymerase III subunit alpha [Bacillus sp. T33-2]PLR98126.1 DNA polymerase III subunit alpha [Bacillus sp. T33-2]